jgi:hypothetical protein
MTLEQTALVMADSRFPWPPTEPVERAQWRPSYYAHAVAIAQMYAVRHGYDLLVYQFLAASRLDGATKAKLRAVCAHPVLGARAAPWCKVVAVYHALSLRPRYTYIVWLDSDVFFRDLSHSIPALLSSYAPESLRDGRTFAWFPDNRPWPDDSPCNSGFFILRSSTGPGSSRDVGGARSFVSRWWSHPNVSWANTAGPFFEQAALMSMWPIEGVVVLGATKAAHGQQASAWRYMGQFGEGIQPNVTTPVTHAMSLHGRQRREDAFRAVQLALALDTATTRGHGHSTVSAKTSFFVVRGFNATLTSRMSVAATEYRPVNDAELHLAAADEESVEAAHAPPARADAMPQRHPRYDCVPDINAPVPCVPDVACPTIDKTVVECAAACDARVDCAVFVHNKFDHCYLRPAIGLASFERTSAGTQLCVRRAQGSPRAAIIQSEPPASARRRPLPEDVRLAAVLVVRSSPPSELYHWLRYHAALGLSPLLVISNECEGDAHEELVDTCRRPLPRHASVLVLDQYRCAAGFQAEAYRAAVTHLWTRLNAAERATMFVGFWDLDEYLVIRPPPSARPPPSSSPSDHQHGVHTLASAAFAAHSYEGPWVLSQQLFGTSFRQRAAKGFVPANYPLRAVAFDASDRHRAFRHLNQSTARPLREYIREHEQYKSICALSRMCDVASREEPCRASSTSAFPRYGGRWVHECAHRSSDPSAPPMWQPSKATVRLHHYYTKSEAELRAKEVGPRADYQGIARRLRTSAAFLPALSEAFDLSLFEGLRHWNASLADELSRLHAPYPAALHRLLATRASKQPLEPSSATPDPSNERPSADGAPSSLSSSSPSPSPSSSRMHSTGAMATWRHRAATMVAWSRQATTKLLIGHNSSSRGKGREPPSKRGSRSASDNDGASKQTRVPPTRVPPGAISSSISAAHGVVRCEIVMVDDRPLSLESASFPLLAAAIVNRRHAERWGCRFTFGVPVKRGRRPMRTQWCKIKVLHELARRHLTRSGERGPRAQGSEPNDWLIYLDGDAVATATHRSPAGLVAALLGKHVSLKSSSSSTRTALPDLVMGREDRSDYLPLHEKRACLNDGVFAVRASEWSMQLMHEWMASGTKSLCADLADAFPGEQGCLERLLTRMSGGYAGGDERTLGWALSADGRGPCRGALRASNGTLLDGRVQLVPMQELNSPWGRLARHYWGLYDGDARAPFEQALRAEGVWNREALEAELQAVLATQQRFECSFADDSANYVASNVQMAPTTA